MCIPVYTSFQLYVCKFVIVCDEVCVHVHTSFYCISFQICIRIVFRSVCSRTFVSVYLYVCNVYMFNCIWRILYLCINRCILLLFSKANICKLAYVHVICMYTWVCIGLCINFYAPICTCVYKYKCLCITVCAEISVYVSDV
jgi:hypothetical protein